MKRKMLILTIFIIFVLSLSACQKENPESSDTFVYFLNTELTDLVKVPYTPKAGKNDTDSLVKEYIELMSRVDENISDYTNPFPPNVKIKKYEFESGKLTLNFNEKYTSDMQREREVLCRCAIVQNMCMIDEVKSVEFIVGDTPLQLASGEEVGAMSAEDFMLDDSENISNIERKSIYLYFASEDGKKLVKEERTVHYRTTTQLEKTVINELIKGPVNDKLKPVISKNTNILNMSVKDGLCYINFDENFLNDPVEGVNDEVAIYALVNSITSLPDISQVQISVNSNQEEMFMETFPLDQIFEKNLTLLK
ncbi:germination protein M [Acetitomaculum ruminis DSM 5522]|uniref:Germination protein M n=1 Tax=Acetitomaculum ruminis DSM 5522 TaxID=1120918 RepID=A0A1I1AGZ4_9FIRM|nr:GerMN domain-containing protein [Acetitomaculum ruminis]SFB37279.1 germination protein M [Acetitomaculum ruminis DSM 5522]